MDAQGTRTALEAALGSDAVRRELAVRRLDAAYLDQLRAYGLPLAAAIAGEVHAGEAPPVIGVNGSQGSGKTTLASFLSLLLAEGLGLRSVVMSIDDFYLTHGERRALGEEVHPLLATRGVPGTHDVALTQKVLDTIEARGADLRVPRFDKATDDRMPEERWTRVTEPLDFALFEGWCVGCRPQAEDALAEPVNELEAREDPDGRWRGFVNAQLAGPYAAIFARFRPLVMLRAPSFDRVYEWRLKQEQELIAARAASGEDASRTMDAAGVRRFIAHYERLTRHMLADLPGRSDAVIAVDDAHRMYALSGPLVDAA